MMKLSLMEEGSEIFLRSLLVLDFNTFAQCHSFCLSGRNTITIL